MKTIEVSDEDYETLMQLSKELQSQPNHYQAFPYFWEPRSERLQLNFHGEGEVTKLICHGDEIDLEETFENDEQNRIQFLEENNYDMDLKFSDLKENQKEEFEQYLIDNCDVEKYTYNWEEATEHNPSLFLSDVQNFVEKNSHHLGRNPSTYGRTIFRMPKMEKLVLAIYRLNKNHNEEINHEAKRAMA